MNTIVFACFIEKKSKGGFEDPKASGPSKVYAHFNGEPARRGLGETSAVRTTVATK